MIELDKGTVLQWRRFLSTEPGQIGLAWLRDRTPSIARGQPHEIQFDAGYNQGYVKCLERITEELIALEKKEVNLENE